MDIRIIKSSLLFGLLAVAGCGASNPPQVSDGHLTFDEPEAESIPKPVAHVAVLPRPEQRPDLETYTVVVHDVPIRELLFSMARDAPYSDIRCCMFLNKGHLPLPARCLQQADSGYWFVVKFDRVF
jgi:hypothetical protein